MVPQKQNGRGTYSSESICVVFPDTNTSSLTPHECLYNCMLTLFAQRLNTNHEMNRQSQDCPLFRHKACSQVACSSAQLTTNLGIPTVIKSDSLLEWLTKLFNTIITINYNSFTFEDANEQTIGRGHLARPRENSDRQSKYGAEMSSTSTIENIWWLNKNQHSSGTC